ncbi:uncharacterized protein ISCGN_031452 [Ixodes scapularis]
MSDDEAPAKQPHNSRQQKPQGLLQKLTLFQIRGTWKRHARDKSSRLFESLPRRLAFRLKDLVSDDVLRAGTVFLGFLADGQFLLSYTLHLEDDAALALPCYKYRLQWWIFVPYGPLVQAGETMLFGDNGIHSDLTLAICQWPTDASKILIYGWSPAVPPQDSCHCYLTLAAVPPLRPCPDCARMQLHERPKHPQRERRPSLESPPRCLRHSFTVHASFQLVSPCPPFLPSVCMRRNHAVLLNTGDTLVVLRVRVEEEHALRAGDVGGDAELGDSPAAGPESEPMKCTSRHCPSEPAKNSREAGTGQCVSQMAHFFAPAAATALDTSTEEAGVGLLSLEVRGLNHELLREVQPTQRTNGPLLSVHQMCLDLEQLADALAKRLCSEQRYVYFAFEDYDAHVVELCPENGTTTILLSLLVQAAESSREATGPQQGSSRTLYRASVLFQWNIDTVPRLESMSRRLCCHSLHQQTRPTRDFFEDALGTRIPDGHHTVMEAEAKPSHSKRRNGRPDQEPLQP